MEFLEIVDTYLKDLIEKGLNKLPVGLVDPAMAVLDDIGAAGWKSWHPIPSSVTETEINELEETIGYALPQSYRQFLRYKHFCELQIDEASFCRHPSKGWRSCQTEMIFDSYPREFLIDKGYIPIAIWSDWGMLCFDSKVNPGDNNYPVALWDHERYDVFEVFSKDFESLIIELDKRATKNGC